MGLGRILTCTCVSACRRRTSIQYTPHGARASPSVRDPGAGRPGTGGPLPGVVQRPACACLPLCLLRRYIASLCAVDRGLVGSGRFSFGRGGYGIDRRVMCSSMCGGLVVATSCRLLVSTGAIRSMHASRARVRGPHAPGASAVGAQRGSIARHACSHCEVATIRELGLSRLRTPEFIGLGQSFFFIAVKNV